MMWEPGPFPKEALRRVRSLDGNSVCMDCGQPETSWGGPTYGILLCVKCAGRHRSLGTHLSIIKSLTMDRWDADQVTRMELGGNGQLEAWFTKCRAENSSLEMKYRTKAATLYRDHLRAAAEEELQDGGRRGTGSRSGPSSSRKGRVFDAAAAAAAADLATEAADAKAAAKRLKARESRRKRGSGHTGPSATAGGGIPAAGAEVPAAVDGAAGSIEARRCGDEEYEVVFGPGSMGFTLMKDGLSRAMVTRLAPGGMAFRLGVRTGDYLVGVGRQRVYDYDQLMLLLPHSPRPMRLLFEGAGAALAAPPPPPRPPARSARSSSSRRGVIDDESSSSSSGSSGSSDGSSWDEEDSSSSGGSTTDSGSSGGVASGAEEMDEVEGVKRGRGQSPDKASNGVGHSRVVPPRTSGEAHGRAPPESSNDGAVGTTPPPAAAAAATTSAVDDDGRAFSGRGSARGTPKPASASRASMESGNKELDARAAPADPAETAERPSRSVKTEAAPIRAPGPKSGSATPEASRETSAVNGNGATGARDGKVSQEVDRGSGSGSGRPEVVEVPDDHSPRPDGDETSRLNGKGETHRPQDTEDSPTNGERVRVNGDEAAAGRAGTNSGSGGKLERSETQRSGVSGREGDDEERGAVDEPSRRVTGASTSAGSRSGDGGVGAPAAGDSMGDPMRPRGHEQKSKAKKGKRADEGRDAKGGKRSTSSKGSSTSSAAPRREPGFEEGVKVYVRERKGSKWRKGLLRRRHGDGSWTVKYSGGMEERRVAVERIRPRDPGETARVAPAVDGRRGEEGHERSSRKDPEGGGRVSKRSGDAGRGQKGGETSGHSSGVWATTDESNGRREEFRAPGELRDDFFKDDGDSSDCDVAALSALSRVDPSVPPASATPAASAVPAYTEMPPRRMEGFGGGGVRAGSWAAGPGAPGTGPSGYSQPPPQRREVVVSFPAGSMGLTLTKLRSGGCNVTRVVPGGVAHTNGVAIGQRVCAVNGQPSGTYEQTMAIIAGSPRPISITFVDPVGTMGAQGPPGLGGPGGAAPGNQTWTDVGMAATVGFMDAANAVAVEWGIGTKTPGVLDEVDSARTVPTAPQGFRVQQKHTLMAIPTGVAGGYGKNLLRHRTYALEVPDNVTAMSTKKVLSDEPGTEQGEFDVEFVEGELGMRLEERGSFKMSSVVVRVTEDGQAQSLGVSEGCVVVGLNGEEYLSHAHTVATLKHARRPISVRFRAPAGRAGR